MHCEAKVTNQPRASSATHAHFFLKGNGALLSEEEVRGHMVRDIGACSTATDIFTALPTEMATPYQR
jgi:hypothetical protein